MFGQKEADVSRNGIAIFCGIFLFALFVVLGSAISGSVSVSMPHYEQLIVFSLFTGISTGHYIGMAMTKKIFS
jgi:hypothetical protein